MGDFDKVSIESINSYVGITAILNILVKKGITSGSEIHNEIKETIDRKVGDNEIKKLLYEQNHIE